MTPTMERVISPRISIWSYLQLYYVFFSACPLSNGCTVVRSYGSRSLGNVMSAVNKSLNISRAIFPFEYFHLSSLSILFLFLSIALLVPLRFLLHCIHLWGKVRLLRKKSQSSLLRSNGTAVELVMNECFLPFIFEYILYIRSY